MVRIASDKGSVVLNLMDLRGTHEDFAKPSSNLNLIIMMNMGIQFGEIGATVIGPEIPEAHYR